MRIFIYLLLLLSFSSHAEGWRLSLSPEHPHQCATVSDDGRANLWVNSKYGFRCEFVLSGPSKIQWGQWSGAKFSITTPANYRPTSVRHSIFQIWQQADKCDNANRGVPLLIVVENGYFELIVNSNSEKCAGFKKGIARTLNPAEPIVAGKTYNFIISTYWDTEQGVTRVILDNHEVAYIDQGIGFNDNDMPIYAFGVYVWPWRNTNNRPLGQVIQYSFTFPRVIQ